MPEQPVSDDYEAALRALDAKGGRSGECPICGGQIWHPGATSVLLPEPDEPDEPVELDGDTGTLKWSGAPVVFVACRGCGYMRLFHHDMLMGGPQ